MKAERSLNSVMLYLILAPHLVLTVAAVGEALPRSQAEPVKGQSLDSVGDGAVTRPRAPLDRP